MDFDISAWRVFSTGMNQVVSVDFLPFLPFFVGYMTIAAIIYATTPPHASWLGICLRTLILGVWFCAGFMFVLVNMSNIAHPISAVLSDSREALSANRALAVLLFGLYFLVLRWFVFEPLGVWLQQVAAQSPQHSIRSKVLRGILWIYEAIAHSPLRSAARFGFAAIMGGTLALMWTPMVGPALAMVLTLAAAEETNARGFFLLLAFSLGMVLPLLLLALAIILVLPIRGKSRQQLWFVEILMGGVIAITGLMMLTDTSSTIALWLLERFPWLVNDN